MSAPTPAPRSFMQNESKKPVPTPRKTIPIKVQDVDNESVKSEDKKEMSPLKDEQKDTSPPTNTFTRRVRTFSNSSKQITEELVGKVSEKKKMVIEGTRQSMRRIARRFTTVGCETIPPSSEPQEERKSEPIGDIFNSITFQSPISLSEQYYANSEVDRLSNHSSESVESLPPPLHPPPPLREDAIYDKPQSLHSSGANSNSNSSSSVPFFCQNLNVYESVYPSYAYNSDSDSCIDMTAGTIERNVEVSRSDSWYYYDPVAKTENIYSNIDSTRTLVAQKVGVTAKSDLDILDEINSNNSKTNRTSYENHQIIEINKTEPTLNSNNSQNHNSQRTSKNDELSTINNSPQTFTDENSNTNLYHNNVRSDETDANKNADALSAAHENVLETSSLSHITVRNSLYENHAVTPPPRLKRGNKRPTTSVIMQFDPLKSEKTDSANVDNLKALEELLQGDLYNSASNPGTYDNWSVSNESEMDEYLNPPTPPIRVDSLPEDSQNSETASIAALEKSSKTNWFVDEASTAGSSDCESPKRQGSNNEWKRPSWFKQVNDVLRKAPEKIRAVNNKNKENLLSRPSIISKGIVQQKGMLYKITSGPVEDLFGEFSARWCILENGSFICYYDSTGDTIKENFPMQNIMSVQALLDQKFKYRYENDDLHCFEVNVSGKIRGGYVYGSRSISERRVWMQKLAESLTNRFNAKITSEYNRLGWAYIREGISGEWNGAWVVLCKRKLYYAIDNYPIKSIDLRKARCIVMQSIQEAEFIPKTNDKGPNMLLDCPSVALYLRMWTSRETKAWCHIVRMYAHNNGALLEQQQLTKNDIPVIVEKCINFIYAHGSMTEGIYRRSGSGNTVQEILTLFRRDAWAVQLTTDKYSEHDVATALKRFFRDLPEPLLSSANRQYLCQVSLVKNVDERVRMYKAVFDQFNPIIYKTIRRLLGHLHFIQTQSKKNLMTVDNLASVWGPTLMHYDEKDDQKYSHKEAVVVAQLITLYKNIFSENAEEMEQEKLMLQVLEKCTMSPQGPVNIKSSGDFRIWVYLNNKHGETFNIAIAPQKTAYDVCLELCGKAKSPVEDLILEELVLNENLSRPVHYKEKVLDVVLRWGYWEEQDRRDNILILSPISKYWDIMQEKLLPVSGELRFADNKAKIFRSYMFEFSQAKLAHYKDKTCSVLLASWNIEDIIWYLGHEPKRNPQSKWTITFIIKKIPPKRTKSSPWFGNVLVWNDPTFRAVWLSSMLNSEHPKDLKPPAQHVNLMST